MTSSWLANRAKKSQEFIFLSSTFIHSNRKKANQDNRSVASPSNPIFCELLESIWFGDMATLIKSVSSHKIDVGILAYIYDVVKLGMMDYSLPLLALSPGMVYRSDVNSIQKYEAIGPFSSIMGTLETDLLYLLFLSCACVKLILELCRHFGCKSTGKMVGLLFCFAAFFFFRFFKCKL